MIKKLILLAVLLTIIFVISLTSNREFNTSFVSSPTKPEGSVTELPDVKKSTSSETEQSRTTTDEASVVIITSEETPSSVGESETKPEEAERIYADFQKLEGIIRRYLSGGHRISMLNFSSLKNLGYLEHEDEYLQNFYRIGIEISGEGYNILIETIEPLTPEVLEILKTKSNVRLTKTGVLQYVFWIRAFKNY